MILLPLPVRPWCPDPKREMVPGLRCLRTMARSLMKSSNTESVKGSAAGARPRGHDYGQYYIQTLWNKKSSLYLNIIFTISLYWTLSSHSSAERFVDQGSTIEHLNLSSISRLPQDTQTFVQTTSQPSEFATLFVLFLSPLFARSFARAKVTLAKGLNRDHRAPESPIAHSSRRSSVQNRFPLRRKTFLKITCIHLSYLALGFLAASLWRNHCIHLRVSTLNIQQLYQPYEKINLRFFAAALIIPFSPDHDNIQRKILYYFSYLFKIDRIVKMGPLDHSYSGIYRPIKDRIAEDETATLRDAEMEAERKAKLQNLPRAHVSNDLADDQAGRKVTWISDRRAHASSAWNQPGDFARRQEEVEGTVAFSGRFNTASYVSKNKSQTQIPTSSLGSGCSTQELVKLPSPGGRFMSIIRKTKSSIFRQPPTHEDEGAPPMPDRQFASKPMSNLFRRNVNVRDHALVATNPSISSPVAVGHIGVTIIRDMDMENAAKAMGFTLNPNRFGFQEQTAGPSSLPRTTSKEASLTAGIMLPWPVSDDENEYTDDESTYFGDDSPQAVSATTGLGTPPSATKLPNPETKGGLDDLGDCHADNMAWLRNAFSITNLDLLKDFGPPPRTETQSLYSNSSFEMSDENTHNSLNDLDTSSMRDDFDSNNGGQAQSADLGHPQPDQLSYERDVAQLRLELSTLVEKYVAKDTELQIIKARERVALNKVKALEEKLRVYGISFESVKKPFEYDDVFAPTVKNRGAYETPTKKGFNSTSKGSLTGDSTDKQSSYKKPKSQEGSFLKSLIGTTEPSLLAFEKLQEQSLLDANTNINDPDLASKLKVSPRQLPPEAPKPASKEPVPKAKGGLSSMLKRLSSTDNLKRKDPRTPASGSPESKNYSVKNTSLNSQNTTSKDASLTSIIEDSPRFYKPLASASSFLSGKEKDMLFSENSISPANHLQPSNNRNYMGNERGMDSNLTSATLDRNTPKYKGRRMTRQGQPGMSLPRHSYQEEHGGYMEEEAHESYNENQSEAGAVINRSAGALAYEDLASLNAGQVAQALRSKPPFRKPPPCPKGPEPSDDPKEASAEYASFKTPERVNPDRPLPELHADDGDHDDGSRSKKKQNFKDLFTQKYE